MLYLVKKKPTGIGNLVSGEGAFYLFIYLILFSQNLTSDLFMNLKPSMLRYMLDYLQK